MTEDEKRILNETLADFKSENPGIEPKIVLRLVW